MHTEIFQLHDDGKVPNNPALPLVLYHDAFPTGTRLDEAITQFAANGWHGAWINGIFDFHHYHARAHECLAGWRTFSSVWNDKLTSSAVRAACGRLGLRARNCFVEAKTGVPWQ